MRETVGLRAEGKRVRSGTSARSIAWGAEWVAAVTELGRRRKGAGRGGGNREVVLDSQVRKGDSRP